MEWNKIECYNDLPQYGKYVMVLGIDNNMYDLENVHICMMDDLEDGFDFRYNGTFYWLTENGTKITNVNFWCEIPSYINKSLVIRKKKIKKLLSILNE